jgi:hypothetical protein
MKLLHPTRSTSSRFQLTLSCEIPRTPRSKLEERGPRISNYSTPRYSCLCVHTLLYRKGSPVRGILYHAAHSERLFFSFCYFRTFLGTNDAPRGLQKIVLWIGSQTKFLTKLWTFEKSSFYSDNKKNQICHDKTTFRLKNHPINNFLNIGNVLIVFSLSSSTHRHTSTRSCYNIYRRLW